MNLKKLSFRNFKSYSNIITEVYFDSDHSVNLIVGENGTGKTSIAECITYLMYGKLENFNASDIPNRINKAFYGKLEMECEGHDVVIERGLNPSLFNVCIDGTAIDTAGKANVQTMLEETYFKIPYSVFHNILVLEANDLKSLLSMNASDKRNIVDKICGFTIYNKYKEFAKEDTKSLEEKMRTNESTLISLTSSLRGYESQIEEIRSNSSSQEEIESLVRKVDEAKKLKEEYGEMLKKLKAAGEELKDSNYKQASDYNVLKTRLQAIEEKISLIEKGRCPTCGTSFDTEEFKAEMKRLTKEANDIKNQMASIKSVIEKAKSKLNALDSKTNEIQRKSDSVRLLDMQSDLKYKQTLNERDSSPIEELKRKISEDIDNLKREKAELDECKKLMDFLNIMFSDGGIKKYISGMYIPIINGLMDGMLKFMNLNYNVTFDSNFDAEIIQNGMKVKYSTLSTGEQRRVDFAAVISFIKFLKIQFGELNLLFLDELFSNVDINGVNDMIEILKELSNEMKINVYLIHHAKLEGVMFDNILYTRKIDGFSRLEYGQQ